MQELRLPGYAFKVRSAPRGEQIFDPVRKKYVALTPEEWVRQHFLNFLVEHRGCPVSLMKVERGLKFNNMQMRTDILIHDRDGGAIAVVECKAPEVKIDQNAFDQIFRYDRVLKVDFLLLTNGIEHYCCQMDHAKSTRTMINEIPRYEEMVRSIQKIYD